MLEKAEAEAEAQRGKAEAQIEKAQKETAYARLETADARRETADAIETLQKLSIENSLLAPRAVIEFVEIFVIAKAYNISGSREQKWEAFFRDTDIGRNILRCVSEENPLWEKDPKRLAGRVKSIYSYSSDYYHQTSLEIQETKRLEVSGKLLKQTLNFINCVAKNCELKLTTRSEE
jgi:hypothetical protein